MDTGEVNKQLRMAMEAARARAAQRRTQDAEVTRAYQAFLEHVATPLVRQLASALKAAGHPFTVFTPADGLRLASDRQRDDFIELGLEPGDDGLQVIVRVSYVRGSRTLDTVRPVKPGASPGAVTEADLLAVLLETLRPWLER